LGVLLYLGGLPFLEIKRITIVFELFCMSFGCNRRILRVDLSKERVSVEEPEEVFYRRYFGGRGLIAYILLRELEKGIDPFSAENKLIFACGPITGAPVSGAGRHSVGAKSPLTGGYGEAEAGGFWGAELKRAGYDAVVVEGLAEEPSYISIADDQVQIRSARSFLGKQLFETQEAIREELGKSTVRIAAIGPAGEKLVRYASIIHDLRYVSGRCGLGAVMGSKRLKAIAVVGTGRVKIAKPKKLGRLAVWMGKNVDKVNRSYHTYGTGEAMGVYEATGNLPVRNFREGVFPNADAISARAVKEKVRVGMETCFACVVRCKKSVKIDEPDCTVDPVYGGPEYETLAALGANCGIDDLNAVCKANELCQRYGLDTISTGVTISFAMECFEKGILKPDLTDGITLNFGDAEAMLHLIELIGERRGIGDLLAEGTQKAALALGHDAEKYAVHVKGQEIPMHDPRVKRAMGLGYAVSPTGADHMHNIHDTLYEARIPSIKKGLGVLEPVPADDLGSRKIRLFYYFSTWNSLNNCLLMCMFPSWSVRQEVEIVRCVTSWNVSAFELMKVSERATNLARVFNVREGFSQKEDKLPQRIMQPKRNGVLSNVGIDAEDLEKAKQIFYRMAGWNEEGIPTSEKLEELDIGWASKKITEQI
jgi:aldehyde:ferredoxin oxidoreductase